MLILSREINAINVILGNIENKYISEKSKDYNLSQDLNHSLIALRLVFNIPALKRDVLRKATKFLSQDMLDVLLMHIEEYEISDSRGMVFWEKDLQGLKPKLTEIKKELSCFVSPPFESRTTVYFKQADYQLIEEGLLSLENTFAENIISFQIEDRTIDELFEKSLNDEHERLKELRTRLRTLEDMTLDIACGRLKERDYLNVLSDLELMIRGLNRLEAQAYENNRDFNQAALGKLLILRYCKY